MAPKSLSLGIPDADWNGYTEARRKQLLVDYQQMTAKIDPYFQSPAQNKKRLKIQIRDGKALMLPFSGWRDYQPMEFVVAENQCDTAPLLPLILTKEKEAKDSALVVCYKGNMLLIDPSRYDFTKQFGSISITSSPLWQQGFIYRNISSNGYAKLQNATISIKILHDYEAL